MLALHEQIKLYLDDCRYMKGLSEKTIKAYSIDLKQFESFTKDIDEWFTKPTLEKYIKETYIRYKPRSAKRKIACMKAFFHHLELEEILTENPFHKIKIKHKEPIILPKTIPLDTITKILHTAYEDTLNENCSDLYHKSTLRNVAVIELLFSSGIRVNELCTLRKKNVDLRNKLIKVDGNGSRERYIYITNQSVITALKLYQKHFIDAIERTDYFFINNRGNRLSEQSVRLMIRNMRIELG